MRIGYMRVSTIEQNIDRQLLGMVLDKHFIDKVSGKNMTNRPALLEMLDYARENDEVFFHSMDRAGRNLKDLLSIIQTLTDKGVTVNFVKENLSFNGTKDSAMARLQLHIMGAVAEFERELINQRIREGVAVAKEAGKYKGRKASLDEEERKVLVSKHRDGVKICQLSKEYGLSRPTIYRYLAEAR